MVRYRAALSGRPPHVGHVGKTLARLDVYVYSIAICRYTDIDIENRMIVIGYKLLVYRYKKYISHTIRYILSEVPLTCIRLSHVPLHTYEQYVPIVSHVIV